MSIRTTAPGAAHSRILGVGSHRASRVVTNEEMCTMVDSTPEWIEQRTGIVERRWATDDETLEYMAEQASRTAIDRAGIEATDIDVVLLATSTHFSQTPSLASRLALTLGTGGAASWDISAACAGFGHALAQADALVRSGVARHVLVIGGDRLSDFTDVTDRGTAFLMADGAGAVVVGPSETPGIGPVSWGSKGEEHHAIQSAHSWLDAHRSGKFPWLEMEGNKVYQWAVTEVAQHAAKTLELSGLSPEELDVFIPHQANNRIIDSMLRRLKLPDNVHIARDIRHLGNTSAASIPLAMDAALASGEARSGQTALLIGFGAGLVWAGQVVVLP